MGSTMSHEHEPLLSKRGAHFEIENRSNSSTVAHDGAGRSEEGTSSLSLVADLKSQQHHQQQQQHNTTQQYNQQENGSEAAPIKNNTTNNHPSTNPPNDPKGASIFQTSLNIAKLCMGTGTLALPFAAEKGGLLFNVVGLGLIGLWNFYSADCLLRCCEFLPGGYNNTMEEDENVGELENGIKSGKNRGYNEKAIGSENQQQQHQQQQQHETIMYGTVDGNGNGDFHHESKTTKTTTTTTAAANHDNHQIYSKVSPPPGGTTTYGKVAWYASGPKGLMVLDLLMLLLFFGLLIAYEVAMMSFINDMPLTTGSRKLDLLLPSIIVSLLSCAPDISFLSNFSVLGLLALALSFSVISWQGLEENGFSGFAHISELNLWPQNWTDASSWFGVVVFGYGVVPVIFNIRDSMAHPQYVGLSTKIGLFIVYVGYVMISNGVRVLFSPTHSFDGDVLQALPDTWISLIVRLLMTFVVAVTAPLIVVPCGELIEGKLGIEATDHYRNRVAIRVILCVLGTIFAELAPGFVHIVSFIGCFCVAMAGFVLPPLFCIQLAIASKHKGKDIGGITTWCQSMWADSELLKDVGLFVIGVIATVITSTLTFIEMVEIR